MNDTTARRVQAQDVTASHQVYVEGVWRQVALVSQPESPDGEQTTIWLDSGPRMSGVQTVVLHPADAIVVR